MTHRTIGVNQQPNDASMKYNLPLHLAEIRRRLARRHNRRILFLLVTMFVLILAALQFSPGHPAQVLLATIAMALIEIMGLIYAIRLSKKQSMVLGFVCPLCGGPLYDGRSNRLGYQGECPCCKKFIIDRLKDFPTPLSTQASGSH
jgi:hypothetical protein